MVVVLFIYLFPRCICKKHKMDVYIDARLLTQRSTGSRSCEARRLMDRKRGSAARSGATWGRVPCAAAPSPGAQSAVAPAETARPEKLGTLQPLPERACPLRSTPGLGVPWAADPGRLGRRCSWKMRDSPPGRNSLVVRVD